MMHACSLQALRNLFLLFILCAGLFASNPALAAASDVRILIDVSGSMKRNDPQNLRAPALRLVSELMPLDTRAGVWLFADDTAILSPLDLVDTDWKQRTAKQLGAIHSRGLHTDIAEAITTASADWNEPDPGTARHLILLTDGLVDVSADPAASAASRADIIATLLPRLNQLGVQTHTIALSSEADTELLRQLSEQTGGRYELTDNAEQLQRIFLRLLEQSAPPTTVPLQDNRFSIDEQVSEFTLLAFHDPGAQTRLIAPDGSVITANAVPKGSAWRAEAGYDLATIGEPQPGDWRLDGVEDPDNRVAIVTDLGMELGTLPGALRLGETRDLAAWLTSEGAPVTRTDLLQLLSATVRPIPTVGNTDPAASPPPPTTLRLDPQNGRFTGRLAAPPVGDYRLEVIIDGGTFKRQIIKPLRVLASAFSLRHAQHLPSDEHPQATLEAMIEFEQELIDPDTLAGFLIVQGPDGRNQVAEITPTSKTPLSFRFPIIRPGEYRLEGRVVATDPEGRIQRFVPPAQTIHFDIPDASPASDDRSDTISWSALAIYLLAGNAGLVLLLLPTWLLLRQHSDAKPRRAADKNKGKTAKKPSSKTKKKPKKPAPADSDDEPTDTPDDGEKEAAS